MVLNQWFNPDLSECALCPEGSKLVMSKTCCNPVRHEGLVVERLPTSSASNACKERPLYELETLRPRLAKVRCESSFPPLPTPSECVVTSLASWDTSKAEAPVFAQKSDWLGLVRAPPTNPSTFPRACIKPKAALEAAERGCWLTR